MSLNATPGGKWCVNISESKEGLIKVSHKSDLHNTTLVDGGC